MIRAVTLISVLLMTIGCNGPRPRAAVTQPAEVGRHRAERSRTDADPVAVSMEVDAAGIRPGDTFGVAVVLDIADGFEIQRLHAPPPAIATQLELKLPPGFQAVGEWSGPPTVRSQWPDGHAAYVGAATFTRPVRVAQDVKRREYELACAIRYQACNDRYCLRPTKVDLAVTIAVAPSSLSSSPAASRR